ncbi:alpha/beta hydrolase [Oceanisphaera sp. KMM 10153]|uniref:alpha/beta hydrolase n=1 Tax=Oceanisphaera submarina TaxID=3390193 RepID=UPI003974DB1C
MKFIAGFFILLLSFSSLAQTLIIHDAERERNIPISVSLPTEARACTLARKCKVAFLSAGNRVPYEQYRFISERLNSLGYLTIAVDHELPQDPPLSRAGDLYQTRIENWQRGAVTLAFLQQQLPDRFTEYDFNQLLLVGHSNGGDISAWLANEGKDYIVNLITLDHRRVSLPKSDAVRVLSIRATEYPTAQAVLLTDAEQREYNGCVVAITDSKHMDLSDYGTAWVKQTVAEVIEGFLSQQSCVAIRHIHKT